MGKLLKWCRKKTSNKAQVKIFIFKNWLKMCKIFSTCVLSYEKNEAKVLNIIHSKIFFDLLLTLKLLESIYHLQWTLLLLRQFYNFRFESNTLVIRKFFDIHFIDQYTKFFAPIWTKTFTAIPEHQTSFL